tara:strand:- start:38 stop:172 length:135 start_codon:yes stop_codon:yes gene_type:complete
MPGKYGYLIFDCIYLNLNEIILLINMEVLESEELKIIYIDSKAI